MSALKAATGRLRHETSCVFDSEIKLRSWNETYLFHFLIKDQAQFTVEFLGKKAYLKLSMPGGKILRFTWTWSESFKECFPMILVAFFSVLLIFGCFVF